MRAWRVHELGDPSKVMSLDEVDRPTPGEGQVLVKVRAAALNFPDVLMAMGTYQEKPPLPYTPGVELCGELRDFVAQDAPRLYECELLHQLMSSTS